MRAEHGVQVLGLAAEVGGGREGLGHWQTVPQCLEARVVPEAGPGEKEHSPPVSKIFARVGCIGNNQRRWVWARLVPGEREVACTGRERRQPEIPGLCPTSTETLDIPAVQGEV